MAEVEARATDASYRAIDRKLGIEANRFEDLDVLRADHTALPVGREAKLGIHHRLPARVLQVAGDHADRDDAGGVHFVSAGGYPAFETSHRTWTTTPVASQSRLSMQIRCVFIGRVRPAESRFVVPVGLVVGQ